jgi:hypothetical protein
LELPENRTKEKQLLSFTTKPDEQGFAYTIDFASGQDAEQEGVLVTIKLGELPPQHDREEPVCSIVAIIAFHNEKKEQEKTLYLDLAFNFTLEEHVTEPLCAWYESLDGLFEDSKLLVTVEIRSLKQTIPLR